MRIALQRIILGVVVIALAGLWAGGCQRRKPPERPFSGFDSLNVRFIGDWPFGPSYAVAHDNSRNLVFCGSGGGVYILDVSNPSNPVKVSEAIHSGGVVNSLFYDPSNHRLYIAGEQGMLEIWDISNLSNPYKLGYYFTPGHALGVYVSGNYAYVADGDSGLKIYQYYSSRH